MTLTSLQALSWSTIAGAVASALLLASGDSRFSPWPAMHTATTAGRSAVVRVAAPASAPSLTERSVSESALRPVR